MKKGYPSSLKVEYASDMVRENDGDGRSMMRYGKWLPYCRFPTLGEGDTPLLDFPRLADQLGVASFQIKDEGQNPTGSHKDRFSPLMVGRAMESGAGTLVVASSGNAGLSVASYAAFNGLGCVVISQENLNEGLRRAIQGTGAELILMKHPLERWHTMRRLVEEKGYFPATNYIKPPVGSNPYGVQGYKTIAYEICEQGGGEVPNVVLVPTSRADLLWGIKEGFHERMRAGRMRHLPRLVAVEPIPRLTAVLAGEDYRKAFTDGRTPLRSIGGNTVTWQGVAALRETKGCAMVIEMEEAQVAQSDLLRQGLYLESSSATVLAAARRLVAQEWIRTEEQVIAIGTSHAWKW
ncbi:threonine synthase [Paludifilum halophilum]|uniref:threonine synthase n=1 Tax=Paludifilum halophilum TaxID=1642702 RepID=UPI00197F02C4|nr:pyridoxal-phosphate dependent enzyme [Paludifilum halophilum]